MRRALKITLFLAFFVSVTALLFEGSLRKLRPHVRTLNLLLYHPSSRSQYDTITTLESLLATTPVGFTPHRSQYGFILNSRSFRTREYVGEKIPGVFRIAVIGDSFAFASGGLPYSKMWFVELERQLNRSAVREFEVFALSAPGVGPRFELRLWEIEHRLLRPDLVILEFYIGNDFTDEQTYEIEETITTTAVRHSYTCRLFRNLHRLYEERHSAKEWLRSAAEDTLLGHGGFELEMASKGTGGSKLNTNLFLKLESRRIQICLKSNRAEFLRLLEDVEEVLLRFRDEVRSTGAEFVVMVIPGRYQVEQPHRSRLLQRLCLDPEDVDVDLPVNLLVDNLNRAEIPCLNLLPLFRSRSQFEDLHHTNGIHWNASGNIFAGEVLAQWLQSDLLKDHEVEEDESLPVIVSAPQDSIPVRYSSNSESDFRKSGDQLQLAGD